MAGSVRLRNCAEKRSLPALMPNCAPRSTQAAVNDTFARQVNALLKQMIDNNNLKYSALETRTPRA